MPWIYENVGPRVRRFIWYKLRFEWGHWSTFSCQGKHIATIWECEEAEDAGRD